jgi:hypothetical protein
MSSILDKRCRLEAVPCNFLYKFIILSWAIKMLRFRTLLWLEVDKGALNIRDCPKYNMRWDILAKS